MENTTIIQKLQAKKDKKGFTLVELVIVIAILAILAAIAIPVIISTINSANLSTYQSETATANMLIKAALNEARTGVHTEYDVSTSVKEDVTTGKVTVDQVFNTNGFKATYTKDIGGTDYHMYWKDGDVFAAAEGSTDAAGATEITAALYIGTDGTLTTTAPTI